MKRYERTLRDWRTSIHNFRNDTERIREIREEIVAFRRARRGEGWELRLGSLDIQLKGFRSDDAMGVGFRRIVLMVGESGEVRYHTGSSNHIQLGEELDQKLRQAPQTGLLEPHYLWYRRIEGVIELAGADSQSKESQANLKIYIDKHKSALVRAMFKLT